MGTTILDVDYYREIIPAEDAEIMLTFFKAIGVHYEPAITERVIAANEAIKSGFPHKYPGRGEVWTENQVDGCNELLEAIVEKSDIDGSIALWEQLVALIAVRCDERKTPENIFGGSYAYFYYGQQREFYESSISKKLKGISWILNRDGDFINAASVSINALSERHQSVNVYAVPEKKYEIRSEDSAVDLQVRKTVKGIEF